jgi:integrase
VEALILYLAKRHQTWWFYHDIPTRLRPYFNGKVRLAKSLETHDERLANQRATPLSFEWQQQLEQAERDIGRGTVVGSAEFWANMLRSSTKEARPAVEERIREEAQEIALANVGDDRGGNEEDQQTWARAVAIEPEANRFFEIAMGKRVSTEGFIDLYKATMTGADRSKNMAVSTIRDFADAFPYVQDVTRKGVQKWIEALSANGVAPKTIARKLSEVRGFWRYLKAHQVAPDETAPFADLVVPKSSALVSRKKRKAYTDAQVLNLLKRANEREDHQLADLIRLGMFTGARIESLCALRLEQVTESTITFLADKTEAGSRTIPVHPDLKPTIKRLRKASTDGYLLSGLSGDNKYEDRSPGIGKRFGRLKSAIGFGRDHDFHSLRRTVVTLLERADVPEGIAADIVGHEKKTITYGLYSDGNVIEGMRKALRKLKYSGYIPH